MCKHNLFAFVKESVENLQKVEYTKGVYIIHKKKKKKQAITVNEVQTDIQKTKDWATQKSPSKKLIVLTLYITSNNKQCGYLEVLHEQHWLFV